ncbi:hypothetical protein ACFX13_025032 [Malus domestica]
MAKKKKKHSQVDEPTKNRLLNALQRFNASTDEVYTFEAGLSSFERA